MWMAQKDEADMERGYFEGYWDIVGSCWRKGVGVWGRLLHYQTSVRLFFSIMPICLHIHPITKNQQRVLRVFPWLLKSQPSQTKGLGENDTHTHTHTPGNYKNDPSLLGCEMEKKKTAQEQKNRGLIYPTTISLFNLHNYVDAWFCNSHLHFSSFPPWHLNSYCHGYWYVFLNPVYKLAFFPVLSREF